MRPTLSLFAAFRPSRPLSNVAPSTAVTTQPIKKYPQPFKLNTSTPHARHIVRAVLTSPAAHATPFGALSNLELYDEIQRQFPEERLKGEDLVSAKKEEEKEEQAWRERSLWGNELKKGKGKEKSKGDGKGDGSEAGKGKPAPDLRPVSSMSHLKRIIVPDMETHGEIEQLHIQRRVKVPSHLRSMFDASSNSFTTFDSASSSSPSSSTDSESSESSSSSAPPSTDPSSTSQSSSDSDSHDSSSRSLYPHIPIGSIPTGTMSRIILPREMAMQLRLKTVPVKHHGLTKRQRKQNRLGPEYHLQLIDPRTKKVVDESKNDEETDRSKLKSTSRETKSAVLQKKVTKVTTPRETWWVDADLEQDGLPNEEWMWRATPESVHSRLDPALVARVTPKERARMKKTMKRQAAWDAKAALASTSSTSASSFNHPYKHRDKYAPKHDRNLKNPTAHGFDGTENRDGQSREEALIEGMQAWANVGASRAGGGSTGKIDVQTGEGRRVGLRSSKIRGDP